MQWIRLNVDFCVWRGHFDDKGQNDDPKQQHKHDPVRPLACYFEKLPTHCTKETGLCAAQLNLFRGCRGNDCCTHCISPDPPFVRCRKTCSRSFVDCAIVSGEI